MKLAMVGLGRMGGNMALRLIRGGHELVVYNRTREKAQPHVDEGAVLADNYADVVAKLEGPRVVWLMLPAGETTESAIAEFLDLLSPGDVLVDGGNANFHTSRERGERARERGITFVDAGVSGGVWGLSEGYCIMAGGEAEAIELLRPACETLVAPGGFAHTGPVGSGHFVKMVHNGIEYGMMQSFAEGFELLHASPEYDLDLHQISQLWQNGSVVRSWLLDLAVNAFADQQGFDAIRGYVQDSGEGRWTVEEGIRTAVPLPAITASLFARFASRQEESFAAKVNAALRNQFGGHAVETK